jgi:hypothetical protein
MMITFAKIDSGIVTEILGLSECAVGNCIGPTHPDYVASAHASCGTAQYPETETIGQQVLADSGFHGFWLECSESGYYHGAYPGINWTYDADLDEFIAPPAPEPIEETP